ncbi:putative nucleic-acid-binding protein [Rhizobium sp. PP-F2F-G48]|uniref:type II toxin-antitoxin system VapC family toxin n=1 Tax=Rhizobium sp. PP-F2F-G48 TaxID=2135651 RepID=UPI001052DC21|nr:type II toxin-antitoxin system VapC family toxin [Rhizobium sp. PP-F2F-G48]TCM58670.1 putative nucleic-acid-binding protein [Rhizobium sp. PP-F2F-G48]
MTTITIDTNILFRILLKDGSDQWQRAARLLQSHRVVIIPTVLLETEWVLRSVAKYSRSRVMHLFQAIMASHDFVIAERNGIEKALAAFEAGMDLADALHLCLSDEATMFVTFDRDLVRRARRHSPNASVELADLL